MEIKWKQSATKQNTICTQAIFEIFIGPVILCIEDPIDRKKTSRYTVDFVFNTFSILIHSQYLDTSTRVI